MKNQRPYITDLAGFLEQFLTLQDKASGVERLIRQHRLAEDQLPLALKIYRQADWRYDAYKLAESLRRQHRAIPEYDAQGMLQRVTIIGEGSSRGQYD